MLPRNVLNVFAISRRKVLLKRRKVQIKTRPLSSKRLKEEQQRINVSFETKKLRIRKELDRRKSKDHHIDQIVEDLFYP